MEASLRAKLKEVFGYDDFKLGQKRIIQGLLEENKDICGVLATGQGKSLCYQFPAIYLNKTVIVISPLISLMKDQKMALSARNISSCVLSSNMSQDDNLNKAIKGGYLLVYTTPEYLTYNWDVLQRMVNNNILGLIAIDEAHCISQWGHDFRPTYRNLVKMREIVSDKIPIVALTATATPTIIKDICTSLSLNDPIIVNTGVARPNLHLFINRKSCIHRNPTPRNILDDLKTVLPPPTNEKQESIIIYTQSRKDAEFIHKCLIDKGYKSNFYHAGLPDDKRQQVHEDFIYEKTPIVVATIAFGMGIDKPNIRKIINWGMPSNLETYYQEIGRAGRDGKDSYCYLFHTPGDIAIQRFLISKTDDVKVQEHHFFLLNIMKNYIENNTICRQTLLSYYFDREMMLTDKEPIDAQTCGHCDNCLKKKTISVSSSISSSSPTASSMNVSTESTDAREEANLLLNLINSLSKNFGLKILILILTGSDNAELHPNFKRSPFYGRGKNHSQVWWKSLGENMLAADYLTYKNVGGLYSTGDPKSKSANFNRVYQVVAIGSKMLPKDSPYFITSVKSNTRLTSYLQQYKNETATSAPIPTPVLIPPPTPTSSANICPFNDDEDTPTPTQHSDSDSDSEESSSPRRNRRPKPISIVDIRRKIYHLGKEK